ncbi:hypothetical protein TNCV_862901 [Trichonephila clavipes]|nr:hypothetical protein TNCV_862901 [Trichonephila clavipes]
MDGKSCAWVEEDVVPGEHSDIFGFGGDESGGSKFKGGHFILVMFSSVCVVTDIEFDDGWDCEQLMHFGSRLQSVEECPADAHLEQVSCPRQEVCESPNLWYLKQRRGFGMYGRILQFRCPALVVVGSLGLLKVNRSDSEITPQQELSVLCGRIVTGDSRKDLASRNDFVCKVELISTSRSPDCKRFTDLGSPPIPIRALLIANGDFVNIPLSGKYKSKNLVCAAILSTLGLGNTRPLPAHSRFGSIWAKSRRGAYLEYTQNIMLQHQSEDPTGKPDHQPIDRSGLTPPSTVKRGPKGTQASILLLTGEAWAKGNAKDPQNTIFFLTGRRTRQTFGLANQWCYSNINKATKS